MKLIDYPFPLDDYTLGYVQLPFGHVLTENEVKRLQEMVASLSLEDQS